ncbi:MAG: NPCBM/NEW2 domain-containing protein, partial [Planctomycetales bacterium]
MIIKIFTIILSATCVLSLADPSFGQDVRYLAKFANGDRVRGKEIQAWYTPSGKPILEKKPLFDPANPAAWVMDLSHPATQIPDALVEFVGGDRLPGKVVGFRRGSQQLDEQVPPCLLVECKPSLATPHRSLSEKHLVRVHARWARRVIWKKRSSNRYHPATLFLRDGRRLTFRAVRWGDGSLRLLREEGTESFSFQRIAELHMPQTDPWNAYLDQLAVLSPNCRSRLIQLETAGGLKITTSGQRFQPDSRGRSANPDRWYQRVQPAWSADPLWVPYRSIRDWRFFSPDAFPLSNLQPDVVETKRALAVSWETQINQNVQGGPLRAGGRNFGWGIGTQAYCRLEYPLPSFAVSFQTSLGVDDVVGGGGCALGAELLAYADGLREAYRSPIL